MRTYTVVNPVPSLVGLMERNFATWSWPISTFGGVVPTLQDPVVAAQMNAHENAIIAYQQSLGLLGYPTYPVVIAYPGFDIVIP